MTLFVKWACGSRKFCQRASNFDNVFFFFSFFFNLIWWGEAGHQRPGSETPFIWRFAGGPMTVQHWMLDWYCDFVNLRGSGPILLRNPIFLQFFRGDPLPPPPLDPHRSCYSDLCSRDEVAKRQDEQINKNRASEVSDATRSFFPSTENVHHSD